MKVFVGLSGGVDSAVAAYLLKKAGHDVTAGFMRNWDAAVNDDYLGNPTIGNDVCPQEQDYHDAKKVADLLGIPLMRIDYVKEYWDDVFSNLVSEYGKGRTPNPDILCNKYIKFDRFHDFAMEKGFDALATGHYAKIVKRGEECLLAKASDRNKDQSYFLDQIDKRVLDHVIFPLEDITKPQVREIAHELNLSSVMDKKDSTGICFIGERDFREFLKNYLPAKTGTMIDIDTGKVMGQMEGVLYYTVGQRKGLQIGGEGGPWFVCGKDVLRNELYVCQGKDNPWLYSDSCLITNVNWLVNDPPQTGFAGCAKFRYRQADNPVIFERAGENVLLKYPQKVKSVAVGQQAVFYDGDICLGGGVIDQVYYNGKERNAEMQERAGFFRIK